MTTESQAPAATEPDAPTTSRMVIGGETVDAADGQTFDLVNPATGKTIGTAPLGGKADVDKAVEGLSDAKSTWDDLPEGKRPTAG